MPRAGLRRFHIMAHLGKAIDEGACPGSPGAQGAFFSNSLVGMIKSGTLL